MVVTTVKLRGYQGSFCYCRLQELTLGHNCFSRGSFHWNAVEKQRQSAHRRPAHKRCFYVVETTFAVPTTAFPKAPATKSRFVDASVDLSWQTLSITARERVWRMMFFAHVSFTRLVALLCVVRSTSLITGPLQPACVYSFNSVRSHSLTVVIQRRELRYTRS